MEASPVTGMKLSTVVPGSLSGENKSRKLTPIDLAMKLHYVRAVYFFKNTCGFTVEDLKLNMFPLLQIYYHVAGRIRMPDNDNNDPSVPATPYIRCNDCGIRIVEANVEEFTVEKWLDLEDRSVDHRFLVYDHVLGHDLFFSPLVFLQITQFKCGGFSIGLSWSHVLGDVFSASTFMNALGQLMSGHTPPKFLNPINPELNSQAQDHCEAISIKRIESVGEHWSLTNKCKMVRHIFNFSLSQIDRLMAKYKAAQDQTCLEVDILSALIWKSVLNIRRETNTNVITICDRKKAQANSLSTCWNEDLVISVVEKKSEMVEISELAGLIAGRKREENSLIKRMIEEDGGFSDFITYGANLTFVNLDMVDMYGFEIKGEKPDFVNYTIHGVGDKGVVLVFPKGELSRIVSVVMPEENIAKLKDEIAFMIM